MTAGSSLKDQLFNAEKARYLAGLFSDAVPGFDADALVAAIMGRLPDLELKQRIDWIADCLGQAFPQPLPDLAPILRAALPPPLSNDRTDNDFGDFIFAPLGELVAARGLERDTDLALDLLAEITQRFSMELAIRPFLVRHPERVLEKMQAWAQHPHYHVRRLVSEGARPKLPWGIGIPLEPDRGLPLLDVLHGDTTRYVTRSVANHLNDIGKSDPDLVVATLRRWHGEVRQSPDELDWMTRHALRSLVKSGHPGAMALLGFDPEVEVTLAALDVPTTIAIGDTLDIRATLEATSDTRALVDWVFWRRRANGALAAKVFKLRQVALRAGEPVTLSKSHRLRGDATTFRLYPGPHRIEIQVNGRVIGGADFELTE